MNTNQKKKQPIVLENPSLNYNPLLYYETPIPVSLGIRPLNLPSNNNSNTSNNNTICDYCVTYCCLICCCIY